MIDASHQLKIASADTEKSFRALSSRSPASKLERYVDKFWMHFDSFAVAVIKTDSRMD